MIRSLSKTDGVIKAVQMDLPFPVSVNTYYRHYNNRMVISARGRKFRQEVEQRILASKEGLPVPLFGDSDVGLSMVLHPPDKRKRDIDNFSGKSVLDSLIGGLYLDDSQVRSLHVEFGEIVKGGKLDLICTRI